MACRYLNQPGQAKLCLACKPERSPSRAELKGFCETTDQRACEFFRFARATGRPLLFEDFVAWQSRRQQGATPVPPLEINIQP